MRHFLTISVLVLAFFAASGPPLPITGQRQEEAQSKWYSLSHRWNEGVVEASESGTMPSFVFDLRMDDGFLLGKRMICETRQSSLPTLVPVNNQDHDIQIQMKSYLLTPIRNQEFRLHANDFEIRNLQNEAVDDWEERIGRTSQAIMKLSAERLNPNVLLQLRDDVLVIVIQNPGIRHFDLPDDYADLMTVPENEVDEE